MPKLKYKTLHFNEGRCKRNWGHKSFYNMARQINACLLPISLTYVDNFVTHKFWFHFLFAFNMTEKYIHNSQFSFYKMLDTIYFGRYNGKIQEHCF